MMNFGYSMLWYCCAYIAVTLIGIGHTVFNIYVLRMSPMDKNSMGEGYEKTKPFHPLYNIIIFPIFGAIYLAGLDAPTVRDAALTGLIWMWITIIVDVVGWVIVKHPWSLSWRSFYIDYQPWISLTYIIIFFAPMIGLIFV